ncbi:DEAD/DEAH box helicase [Alteromonas sp. a30]|uniref:DEAD/DEAH box helicase n=1 Tax=Alteromonas sp. a30 TaxID=2730917 RepID=UPI00227E6DB3|nr:DEAD/DEAH box helicase [Alteromonas sp. a30]MCY7294840.1 DEAD/DEAH box helicase [Alteromonas sp. a30]
MTSDVSISFKDLKLPQPILDALDKIGYEKPSPIQAATIPYLLEGRDLIGQAQTGTGKTAAFALPMLSKIDDQLKAPQLLVLAPTRELAIQVAEAFQAYASFNRQLRVLPIYGGQSYDNQIRQLKRGTQVIVGTPGRVIDHIKRKTLDLSNLKMLVLDEADEMLRMGFIDDVEWILSQAPDGRQTALFSATMPAPIQKIASKYLNNPETIKIASKTSTANSIRQRFCQVTGHHKLSALTRVLEVENFDGVIIFVRTKTATVELAEKLSARGYDVEPLNGDIPQKSRERTVERLKQGKIDILIATDVVARGLDVDRVSHVVNYDVPYDTESYVHRIGRTGRAGRTGDAILFVSHREMRLLRTIERATKQKMDPMPIPTLTEMNESRLQKFKERVCEALEEDVTDALLPVIEAIQKETEASPEQLLSAFAKLAQGDEPLILRESDVPDISSSPRREKEGGKGRDNREGRERGGKREGRERSNRSRSSKPEKGMQRYRIAVGRSHGVKPGNIVGAIANEASIDSQYIGAIEIYDNFSTVDLPEGMPSDISQTLKNTRVAGQKLDIREWVERKNRES